MKAVVLGAGKSGNAAFELLSSLGIAPTLLDGEMPFPEGDFSFVVVSPGVALTHSWLEVARQRKIPVKSELQLGCEVLKKRGCKLVAITGSKGKSSVVRLVADALNLSGVSAVACGNYGVPVSEVALRGKCEWAVVEVSSFMMETTELAHDTFEAAMILNLQADHLDRHGSLALYHALKRKLLTMVRTSENAMDWSLPHEVDGRIALLAGSYFDNEILRRNGFAAICMLAGIGVGEAAIARAFKEFTPLKHRMNLISEREGVKYIDDSKATNIAALIAGVAMVGGNVRLIAGGLPKGDDIKSALPILTRWVKKVYLIGQSAEKFAMAWRGSVDCEICGTLQRAVAAAMREAAKGETVLLSPGTASFDQFKSFEERGDVFAELVKKEGKVK